MLEIRSGGLRGLSRMAWKPARFDFRRFGTSVRCTVVDSLDREVQLQFDAATLAAFCGEAMRVLSRVNVVVVGKGSQDERRAG